MRVGRNHDHFLPVPDLQVRADGVTALHLAAEAGFVGEPNTEEDVEDHPSWERIKKG